MSDESDDGRPADDPWTDGWESATEHTVDESRADGEAATVDAEAHIAIWPATDTYVMAGGLVPLEAPDDADVLEAALDIDPARDREAIVDLFRGLDLEATDED